MKRNSHNIKLVFALGILLVGMLACSSLSVPAAPAVAPTLESLATATSVPLYRQVTLISVPSEESGQPTSYQITVQTPTLTGSDDPRVKKFNDEMTALIANAVADFKNNLTQMPPSPLSVSSSFDVKYELLSPPGNIFSIKFDTMGYVSGAAHPYHLSYTSNYDLEAGKDIALADLFLPNSDYLETIANYCAAQLSMRDIGFEGGFQQGAAPLPDNYKNWNITADGLLITFDEYQVAPYAAGPQTVVIPYGDIAQVIDYHGPLALYLQ